MKKSIELLEYYLEYFPAMVNDHAPAKLALKLSSTSWSKKEIVGHLIDSATINLMRFVRGQFEENPSILYEQDGWCKYNYYQQADTQELLNHWIATNRQLVFIWRQLPASAWIRLVNGQTLAYLASDYMVHLTHHINQIESDHEN